MTKALKCRILSWDEGLRRKHGGWGLMAVASAVVSGSLPYVQSSAATGWMMAPMWPGSVGITRGFPSHKNRGLQTGDSPQT